jgi:hypothetical protein
MRRYRRDLEAARRRLAARQRHSIRTRYGSIEYAERGTGPPLLFPTCCSAASTWAWEPPTATWAAASG